MFFIAFRRVVFALSLNESPLDPLLEIHHNHRGMRSALAALRRRYDFSPY